MDDSQTGYVTNHIDRHRSLVVRCRKDPYHVAIFFNWRENIGIADNHRLKLRFNKTKPFTIGGVSFLEGDYTAVHHEDTDHILSLLKRSNKIAAQAKASYRSTEVNVFSLMGFTKAFNKTCKAP